MVYEFDELKLFMLEEQCIMWMIYNSFVCNGVMLDGEVKKCYVEIN